MKRWGVPVLIGLLILAAVSIWGYRQYQDRVALQNYLSNKYHLAFYNLTGRVQNMEVLLGKTLAVAGQPDDTVLFSEIWLQSEGARENLTQLPVNSQVVGRTAKFLAQVGDYARVKAREINNGETLTEEEFKTLNNLYRQAAQLNKDLHDMEAKISDGRLNIGELATAVRQEMKQGAPANVPANFQSIDRNMQGYPTLVYDGPFSDHMEKVRPVGLKGKTIGSDDARGIVRDFIDTRGGSYRVQVTGRTKERIPGYLVELIPEKNNQAGRVSAGVSETGGHVIWYLNHRTIGNPKLNVQQALDRAQRFLSARGYKNMVNIYNQQQDGRVIFNFAPQQQGVIIYPDQIKVNVALDNGQIVGFDARGYLMAHKERKIVSPKVTEQQARLKVNPKMQISKTRLAIIPTDSGMERYSYEFTGQVNGDSYLVYINAMTGKTDQVLKLIQSRDGTLSM
ncbi:germination protein YpeB [Desulfotomaculum nigrificans CO-1-SRB]|uniref:Germination protein YpeB n=1 Tax=Desulfotomaculum nigrificans (strain DSM 14880 / VKM B-2319 / CO-1-SRB) TaxID=868595 RepID=F6B669_DESCC|nr:germination protein YpeB [Desulfotomaculum nigrificans]AEF95492.1 germination protein YpeB [Desulfotomaculum nigrificans CO-1-SRB]